MKIYAGYDDNLINFNTHMSQIIVAVREDKNLTQQQLANLCGMHPQAINRMENQRNVSLKQLCKITKATNLKLVVIVGDLDMSTWRYLHTTES